MNLLLRADASIAIGTGHVMRCLALAQAWQDGGGRSFFAMAEETSAIRARLANELFEVVSVSSAAGTTDDASQTIALARERKSDWIAVDGYRFSSDYQCALKAAGFRVLCLDDYGHSEYYSADLVLNQNVSARAGLYMDREPYTRLLLGPRYCLLRREFGAWRDWRREISSVCQRMLVTMGGSDPENLTARVIEALDLARLEIMETTVVIGGSNPHFAMLQNLAVQSGQRISVQRDLSNMAEPMAAADLAISAAGSTCWELFLLGVPALLLDMADNQTEVVKELDRRGCAIRVGDRTVSVDGIADQLRRLVRSRELRESLSRCSRELVDGKGAMRVVSVLRGTEGLKLRPARPDDARLLWEWANDPEVRAASFSSDPIPWADHVAWFADKLSPKEENEVAEMSRQKTSQILIAEDEDANPLGQIRFDRRFDRDWEVDLSIVKPMRGRGIACHLISLGVQVILKEDRDARVHAFVKPANVASVRAFEQASFKRLNVEEVRSHAAIHLIYEQEAPNR